MNYNSNQNDCLTSVQPALSQTNLRLVECVNRFEALILDIKNKLQLIKKIDEPCSNNSDLKEKQPDCIMDELNKTISRMSEYNDRLDGCLNHLNQIV